MIYNKNIQEYTGQINKLKKQKRQIAILRGIAFILSVVFIYNFFDDYSIVLFTLFSVFIISFFILIQIDYKLKYKIKYIGNLLKINTNEDAFLKGDFSAFNNGKEFIDFNHPYSYDLDIFGEKSIFHYLNRTTTISGKVKLAKSIAVLEKDKNKTEQKQQAIEELSANLEFRQKFSALGMFNDNDNDKNIINDNVKSDIIKWLSSNNLFYKKTIWKILLYVIPVISIGLLIGSIIGTLSFNIFYLWGLVQLGVVGIYFKRINNEHQQLSQKHETLKVLQKLILHVEAENFSSIYLRGIVDKISLDKKSAGILLKKFNNNLKAFDSRLNMIVAVVFNMSVMWDIQVVYRLERIKEELKTAMPEWFEAIGEIDSLISLANFNFNNPSFVLPKVEKETFIFKAHNMGHPLISTEDRITNNFEITGFNKMIIVTGANMAGKSTFLRTVGVNIILASAGVKVCAEKFNYYPIDIFTSVRTNDSLQKNESYFYSELMRLKKIIDKLKTGAELFIILDEMLKGTNSHDKHKGSEALIEQVIKYNMSGLAATHDVELGVLKQKYPNNIDTKKFEVDIIENDIKFDYKLKDGVSQNLNATFLMKKYGIIENI